MRPFTDADRFWPLERLRTYALFHLSDPAWPWDPDAPDVAAGRRVLKFQSIREMAAEADRMCEGRVGHKPPSQVALFLYQFPDRDYEDCLYAHWALHADKTIGPGACAAAIWIEPLEFPDDGPEIQYWATWHLTQHPWNGAARHFAEKLLRSSKVVWVSPQARQRLVDHLKAHHADADAFLAQAPLHHHPLHTPAR
jgi:hypothetical protein